jgi:hypothetical protein
MRVRATLRLPPEDWGHGKGTAMRRLVNGGLVSLPYLLIAAVAVLRLTMWHPFNVVPVFSCILFFGAARPRREFLVPLVALIGADISLTTQIYHYALSIDQTVTWAWYLVVILLGDRILRNASSMMPVAGTSLLASIGFFLTSNLAVWMSWNMYPKSLSGLGACYVAALPFFRNSLVSETACSVLIFNVWKFRKAPRPVALGSA